MKRTALFILMGLASTHTLATTFLITGSISDIYTENWTEEYIDISPYLSIDTTFQATIQYDSAEAIPDQYGSILPTALITIDFNNGQSVSTLGSLFAETFTNSTYSYISFYSNNIFSSFPQYAIAGLQLNLIAAPDNLSGLEIISPYYAGIRLNSSPTGSDGGEDSYWIDANSNTITEVSEVPVPAAAWLMGSGLLGLTAAARRKKV